MYILRYTYFYYHSYYHHYYHDYYDDYDYHLNLQVLRIMLNALLALLQLRMLCYK